MRPVPPRGERALPVLSGALLALAYPPAAFLLPSFVALVPLLVFITERPPGPAGRWSATRAGLVAGTVYFGAQLYWLAVALVRYSALAIPAYLLTVLLLAILTGGFAWAVHLTRERTRLPLALLAATFWTTLEWLQGRLGDLAFPWLGLGTSLAPFPTLAGAADLVGARGLTFWLAAVNGMAATLLLRHRAGAPLRALAAGTAVLVALPIAYGAWRAASIEMRPVARVAVVQPNIPEEIKLDPRLGLDSSLTALAALTRQAGREAVDLVAWPEVALPVELAAGGELLSVLRRISRDADAPVLAGAYGIDGSPDDPTLFNSAFLVEAAGPRGTRYDKRYLVPFVERVPFLDPALLRGLVGDGGRFAVLGRGRSAPVLPLDDSARFGILICYESIFAQHARRYRAAGADFLVNITNDAWYGREPWYARTTALWQHPAHLTMRAIETRVGIARAANTGISMFVDPLGRTHQRTPLFQADLRVDDVLTTDEVTLFVRWGDWLATLAALAAVGLLAASLRRRDPVPA